MAISPSGPQYPYPAGGATPCVVPEYPVPDRTAVTVVVLVLVLSTVLVAAGHPAQAVLGLLAGAGYIGTELVRRLGGGE